ncbi:MAG: ribose ABC transporter [Deltaproteobacteria bacterium]|jgi:L-fucose mutarotase|nr:ribose ABC transporter [Deltaproteobacteria bacterium]
MLKNLDPLLTPELLYVLRAMGHGDELILADCNFPSDSIASETTYGSLIRLDGNTISEAADAILSVMPLDSFVDSPILRMEVVGNPGEVLDVHSDLKKSVDKFSDKEWPMGSIERHAFYDRAKQAYAVVSTSERRPYGCFVLVKGIIGPDGNVG